MILHCIALLPAHCALLACCLLLAACLPHPTLAADAAVVENYGAKKKKGKEWQDAMLSSNVNFDLSTPFSL